MDATIDSEQQVYWFVRLNQWRKEHISEKMFVLILAFFVGLFSAVAAFILHWIINEIVFLLTSQFNADSYNWLYLVYPVVGIYLTSLFVRYIVKDNISHGIIDLLIEDEANMIIIDYKLNNIDDENYDKQLNGYRSYIESISNKKVNCYLYSIIDNNYREVLK